MHYFLDTEFNQTVDPVELISLGIVCEDGRELYTTSNEFRRYCCDEWLQRNVLPILEMKEVLKPETRVFLNVSLRTMRAHLEQFLLRDEGKIQVWGYYAGYDWFLFTRLWGFLDMPKGFPSLCLDIKQFQYHLAVPELPQVLQPEHHALVDARWNRKAFDYLTRAHR